MSAQYMVAYTFVFYKSKLESQQLMLEKEVREA